MEDFIICLWSSFTAEQFPMKKRYKMSILHSFHTYKYIRGYRYVAQ